MTSPAPSFRYRCIDMSPIPLTNAVGKLFLKSEKIFYQKFSWGGKNPLIKQKMGLILKQEGMSTSRASPRHLWNEMLTGARQPFPGYRSRRAAERQQEEWEMVRGASPAPPQTLGSLGPRYPRTAPWHPWRGTNQTCNLEAIPCLGAGLLLSFPSPPVSLHFLSGSRRAPSVV